VVNTKRIAEDLDSVGTPGEDPPALGQGKLITSVNGPKGGYVLARDPGQIRVSEVLRAIEGPSVW
jgi:hypothetical protein